MVTPGCQFASDNTSGICPEAWAALQDANQGCAASYGEDAWTAKASDLVRDLFETDCDVFFVFNGTAANSLLLASLCQSYHSVIATSVSHIETDECNAPQLFSGGIKLLVEETPDGRLTPDGVRQLARQRGDMHHPTPRAVSVTQSTELGTVYSCDALQALGRECAETGLRFHMDGARFFNAAVALDRAPSDWTWKVGVDVLSLGGTKCGLPVGEMVVFFDRELAYEFDFRCKQAGQLASKMRFLAAPWCGFLQDGAWRRHAAHANACAQQLGQQLAEIKGVSFTAPIEANAVFAEMPEAWLCDLRQQGWVLHSFFGEGTARLMCSWMTGEDELDTLVNAVRQMARKVPV